MKKRLFVSISLPLEWQDAFADYCKQFQAHDMGWTPKENIHITACFLGEVEEKHIGDIKEKLKSLCAHTEPFSLLFEKVDFAPPNMSPRMVWAEFSQSDAYRQFVEEMQKELRSFLSVEPHEEIIPHATLARFKNPALVKEIDLSKSLPELTSFDVRFVDLVESRFDSAGVRYETLETFPLSKKIKMYQILSHTADVRLKAEGSTIEELFCAALRGMAEIQNAKRTRQPADENEKVKKEIHITSPDQTALLIDFLSEVLAQSQIEKTVFDEVIVKKLSGTELKAEVTGERVEGFGEDIKAVTYHGAEIIQNDAGNYEVTILFDI
ncbi:MAG: RNA 2',3'-cyclic phosphodiesterase [Parcubacteria group bacterium]|nr:RNA 2',3'-cyclic phosphodiesterase [Parcubacteria group bacterium]MCR4342795.1 RNA 2',3'-cyclic phosphodiesterase [Patescibacteria group bacterium]